MIVQCKIFIFIGLIFCNGDGNFASGRNMHPTCIFNDNYCDCGDDEPFSR